MTAPRRARFCAPGALALMVCAGAGGAQQSAPRPGARVRVAAAGGPWPTGTLARATADSLWLQAEGSGAVRAVPLGPDARLERSLGTRSRAATGALLGAAVGAVVTVGFLSVFCGGDTLCDGDEQVRAALIFGGPSIAIGTVIGALIRTERWARVALPIVAGAGRGELWRAGVAVGL